MSRLSGIRMGHARAVAMLTYAVFVAWLAIAKVGPVLVSGAVLLAALAVVAIGYRWTARQEGRSLRTMFVLVAFGPIAMIAFTAVERLPLALFAGMLIGVSAGGAVVVAARAWQRRADSDQAPVSVVIGAVALLVFAAIAVAWASAGAWTLTVAFILLVGVAFVSWFGRRRGRVP
jgi:hypothetical protein